MVEKFIKKPIEVEALQWTGQNHREMWEFLEGSPDDYMKAMNENFYIDHNKVERGLIIKTSEGDMIARVNDFIIKEPFDKQRKYYPCKPDVFNNTYGLADDFETRKIVAAQQYALDESKTRDTGALTRIKTAWEKGFETCIEYLKEQK